jgi:hypoxanthine phosphoribosyltransferase
MSNYQQQIHCPSSDIDLDFWRAPEGVCVPDDELTFLLVPDAVEAMAVLEVSRKVHKFQLTHATDGEAITCALMATMGGMLPGILLYDHLVKGRPVQTPRMEFGTIGVSLYKGPNERYDQPQVQHDISISIQDEIVLVIDDLGDRGGTLQFLKQFIAEKGAKKVLTLALYMKPMAIAACPVNFSFGEVTQDTWIITPRETVETMIKRVPVWIERGADQRECRRRLVDMIGYSPPLADYYLKQIFAAS